ncbi:MAG: sigma-70 family RNA polymerase sigma factor [Bacteroidia bacterium]|nr:sigma-70 family RNA polymerase sigma factor [Bacteroidia bacterium]
MNPAFRTLTDADLQAEQALVEAAQRNPRRFAPLYDRYYDRIFLFLYKRTDDEEISADLCSQVFLKALQHLPRYRFTGAPFSAWLFRIAVNEVNQYFRQAKRARVISLETVKLRQLVAEADEPRSDAAMQAMIRVLQLLKPEELEYIELRFFEELSFRELGEIYGITENNAKVRMYRLLDRVKALMVKSGLPPADEPAAC